MIDTGCAHTAEELARALSERRVERILNTHSHEDHIGANARLQRHGGIEILAHPLSLPVLANPRQKQPLHPYRRLFWGWPEPSQAKAVEDGEMITTERYRFQVVYTPGHSQDHLCLYEPSQGWLFSGDVFVGGQDRALRQGSDIWQMIASLKLLNQLSLSWLFPGSARVREAPKQDIEAKIAYYERLGAQVLELREQGRSVAEIPRAVCGPPIFIEFVTLGHFSRHWLVRSYLGDHS
jgi:glyoxylase-like metal-dependent hydrolase (beta-lactamase superfamily II)